MILIRREWNAYIRRYSSARKALNVFAAIVEDSDWRHTRDVKDALRTPSIVRSRIGSSGLQHQG